jgi:hypothetical protein
MILLCVLVLRTQVNMMVEHWTSIGRALDQYPNKGLIPTVVRQTFQLARCGCTLRVTSIPCYNYLLQVRCRIRECMRVDSFRVKTSLEHSSKLYFVNL